MTWSLDIEPRAMQRVLKLARRIQSRFWALARDLHHQGPTPLGWADVVQLDSETSRCLLGHRYYGAWSRRGAQTLEVVAPTLSAEKLEYLQGSTFEELLLRLQNPAVELRLSGPGAPEFLAHLREHYPGQVRPARDAVDLPSTSWYKRWSKLMVPGKCLHIYRQNAGMALHELAQVTGYERRLLGAWEEGTMTLTPDDARALALYLECDYTSIFSPSVP